MTTQKKSKQTVFLIFLFAIVYFTSYLTRNSYNSAISEITESLQTTSDATGIVSTCAFLTYGFGQIICGLLGDRIAPRKMILAGLAATSVCNLLMPVIGGNITMMAVLWGINGFTQAMFWPPLVRLMAEQFSENDYNDCMVAVTTASSFGNILIYLISPLCIAISGWRLLFVITGFCGIAMFALWVVGTRSMHQEKGAGVLAQEAVSAEKKDEEVSVSVKSMIVMSGLVFILIGIVMQGMLRDGVTTWMPSLISSTFHLSSEISILTAVVLPIFAIISIKVSSMVQKKIGNELLCAAIFFGIGLVCSVLMLLLFSVSVIVSILMMALITACMHGINLMLISYVPRYFARYGKISTMSGLLNAFTYIGSAISTYGFALLSERYGWHFTIGSWAVIAGVGMIACAIIIRRWKRFAR
ncbi:MAG: MFS transporter [Clostridia bacterium]|nr:MFS transporter [Clostridia bacterium]